MSTKTKAIIITLVFGVPAFLLSNVIWPPSPDLTPTSGQLPFFIILSAIESLVFGIGAAFIILSWNKVKDNWLVFFAISWTLISWWPHDNMHKHNGSDLAGLLVIEYLFHVTLIIAAIIIASHFWKQYHKSTLN